MTSLYGASRAFRALEIRHDSQDSSTISWGPAESSLAAINCESPSGTGLTLLARLRCKSRAALRVTLKSHVEKPPRVGSKVPEERHTFKNTSWVSSSARDRSPSI